MILFDELSSKKNVSGNQSSTHHLDKPRLPYNEAIFIWMVKLIVRTWDTDHLLSINARGLVDAVKFMVRSDILPMHVLGLFLFAEH